MEKTKRPTTLGILAAAGLGSFAAWRLMRRARAMDLGGKVAVIMGGSRGLGLLLARECAQRGCAVAICARDTQELDAAVADLHARGATTFAAPCNVADAGDVQRFLNDVQDRFDRIDILINNAGVIGVGPALTMCLDDFERALDVMFRGMLHATWATLPGMIERGAGSIVNITSIGGMISVPHLLPYSSAKFAAVGFSQGLHAEMARYGIRVTTVVPGLMRIGSHLNAEFRGDAEAEYAWFAAGATLPGVSIKAERAARKIISAIEHGDAVAFIGIQANIAARLAGLFPELAAQSMALVNAMLPREDSDRTVVRGSIAADRIDSPVFDAMTSLGRDAAQRTQQFTGRRSTLPERSSKPSSEPTPKPQRFSSTIQSAPYPAPH